MAEAEAPGNVGLADEIQAQQLVERVDRCRLGGSGGRGRQLGIEGVSRDGGALEDEACLLGEQSELLGERGGDRSRDVDAAERRLGRAAPALSGRSSRPRELLEVEGIAAAVLVEARSRPLRSPISSRASSGLSAPSSMRAIVPARCARSTRGAEPLAHLPRSHGERESTCAAGGRWRSAPSSSTDAGSAQWTSSSTSTTGWVCASVSSSTQTARWLR